MLYVGLFIGVGGAFFAAWIASRLETTSAVLIALFIALITIPLSIGLQGADVLVRSPRLDRRRAEHCLRLLFAAS